MTRRYYTIFALLCASGAAISEPVSDLQAFHSAWVVSQGGKNLCEPAMILGGLDVFSRVAPRAVTESQCGASPCSVLPAVWDQQVETLEAEAVFLGRSAPNSLPDQKPDRFLPARTYAVLPGERVHIKMPGRGSRAVLVLSLGTIEMTLSDVDEKILCATTGRALFCSFAEQGKIDATLFNPEDVVAQILVLGEAG